LDLIARELGVENLVRSRAGKLIDLFLGERPESTPKPRIMAGAALYMSSILLGRPISQDEVCRATATTPPTLRRWYKQMAAVLFPQGDLRAACPRA
jgi:transcription initiation factor TFIIIB Brf1 subunit/transcription initiation factor TFIIB